MYDPMAYDSELTALLKLLNKWELDATEKPAWSGADLGVASDAWQAAPLPPCGGPQNNGLNRRTSKGGLQG